MRDIAVTLLFIYGAVLTLRRPYFGVLLWVWIGLMNPHRLGWGFAYSFPFAMLDVVIMTIAMVANSRQVRWPGGGPLATLILLIAWMGLTTILAIHQDISIERYSAVLKVLVMTLVCATVVKSREEIIGLVWVIAMSMDFFGLKGGIFTLATGGSFRVWGPPASAVEGNNELAVALIMTIPLFYFLAVQSGISFKLPVLRWVNEKWLRRLLYASMVFCAVAAIGSHSRGALLAIAAMTSMLWWRSKSKLIVGVALLVVVPALLMFMPEEWLGRMNTIKTYDTDDSAMGRINAWTMAINIANHRLTGAGFATDSSLIYQMYAPNPNFVIVAHSIYFQILGEHGYIGLALYLTFWWLTYRTAGRVSELAKSLPDGAWAVHLASMMKVSLVGFAVGGAFLSLAYWDMPFYFMIVVVVTYRWVVERVAEEKSRLAASPAPSQQALGRVPAN